MPTLARHRIRSSLAAAALACSLAAHADTGFTPQSGTWIVSGELDGKPGRGMAIDVQDGIMVMQVYNYREGGSATFHLATGAVVDNAVTAPLLRYRGGRSFGSPARSGVEDGNAGDVQIRFTSGATGTVQFPGEAPVAMQRYRFDGVAPGTLANRNLWLVALLDEGGQVAQVHTAATGIRLPAADGQPAFALYQGFVAESSTLPCTYQAQSTSFRCRAAGLNSAVVQFQEVGNQLTGVLNQDYKTYRLVGQRLLDGSGPAMDVLATEMGVPPMPDNGTWIVRDELDGKPGRGMAIDVQGGTLVMQIYNYDAAGNATFHLATAPYANGEATGALKQYGGGRWFGSGARSGAEVADAGTVYLAFDSTTVGTVHFPGEAPQAIQRYHFGAQAPDPHSLLGTWALRDDTNDKVRTLALSVVEGDVATDSDGKVRCWYSNPATQQVRCTEIVPYGDRSRIYRADYRFQVQGALALGKALPAGTQVRGGTPDDSQISFGTLRGLRLVDRHGVQAGLGSMN